MWNPKSAFFLCTLFSLLTLQLLLYSSSCLMMEIETGTSIAKRGSCKVCWHVIVPISDNSSSSPLLLFLRKDLSMVCHFQLLGDFACGKPAVKIENCYCGMLQWSEIQANCWASRSRVCDCKDAVMARILRIGHNFHLFSAIANWVIKWEPPVVKIEAIGVKYLWKIIFTRLYYMLKEHQKYFYSV